MLIISTVSRSLALQSPVSWDIAGERGLELTFAAAEDRWSDELRRRGSFVPLAGSRSVDPLALARLARGLRRLAASADWDLVQVQTPIVAALWRVIAPARLRRRTVYVAHGFHFQEGERGPGAAAFRTVERLLAHRAGTVATVSREDSAWLTSLPPRLRPDLTWSLPGAGVDVARFRDAGGAPPDGVRRPYVLFCGDLNENKDPLLAVETVGRCRARHPDLDLVVIGEGPLRPLLERAAESRPWLRLVESTREMELWVKNATALLAPSRREGVPRVIIEALAAGTPVVARSNRGSRELLAGGVGAVLPGDATAEEWASRLAAILGEPPATGRMLERAMSYDVGMYRLSYSRLLDVMQDAADHERPRPVLTA